MQKLKQKGPAVADQQQEVLGTQRAAELLGVSVRTVQLWVENGTLQAWRTPGNHRRILRSSIDAVLKARDGEEPVEAPSLDDVLIVEDELTMQAYYEATFNLLKPELGLRFADDGFAGLVEFGRKTPRLMVLDLDLPGMDGIELIRAIERQGEATTNIVIATGLDAEQITARGGLPEGIPVLSKPVSVNDLEQLLQQYFSD